MKKYLPSAFSSLGIIVAVTLILLQGKHIVTTVQSATNHVVISEVMLSAGTGVTTKEFIELYNPTGADVNLTNWKIAKKNEAATGEQFLVSTMSGTIPAHGFFLIASEAYNTDATVAAETTYSTASASLTVDNTILLYDDTSGVVDKVGFGTAVDVETDAEPNPSSGSSRERKAQSDSTSTDMAIGGAHELLGNGEDSDNNNNDFNPRSIPQPQNTLSVIEPVLDSPPTATPTPTTTAFPTASPSPTVSPTVTPTPSTSPSPSPTPTVTSSPTLSPAPTSTPGNGDFPFPFMTFSCKVTYKTLHFGFFTLQMPLIRCGFSL